MNTIWFLLFNFSLIGLALLTILAVAAIIGQRAGINWCADLIGDLLSSPRHNAWLVLAICGIVAVNLEAAIVYEARPLVSPLPSASAVAGKIYEKVSGSDGHALERLATMFNQNKPVEFKAVTKPEEPTQESAMRKFLAARINSYVWLIAAILSWPIGILWIGFILSDDFLGRLATMVGGLWGGKIRGATGSEARPTPTGTTREKSSWKSSIGKILLFVAGMIGVDAFAEFGGTLLGKYLAKEAEKAGV